MAIIEGSDGDELDSNSDCDRSVTSFGSDEGMGHEAVHEEQCAVDVVGPEPGTWNADDGSYNSSTEPDSEEILSDAEEMGAESCDITQTQNRIESITNQLKEQGWDE